MRKRLHRHACVTHESARVRERGCEDRGKREQRSTAAAGAATTAAAAAIHYRVLVFCNSTPDVEGEGGEEKERLRERELRLSERVKKQACKRGIRT